MTDTSNVEVEIGGEELEQDSERSDEGEATPEENQERADEVREAQDVS